MHGHIITGYDGSKSSEVAVRWAADEAVRRQVGLTVVGCYAAPVMTDFGLSLDTFLTSATVRLREQTQARMDELTTELTVSHPGLTVNACAIHGRAHRLLVEQAERADLIVIGSTGSSETDGSFMGSVARAVIRNSPCPVVVVPGEHPWPERPHVVVAADGSDRSARAVEWAVDETDLLGGQLLIVHSFWYPYGDDQAPTEAHELMRIDAACQLDEVIEQARARAGSNVDGALAEGRPATEIIRNASGADMIVVGTRERSGTLHLAVLGSVAEAVASHAPCPVVVVREGIDR